MCVPQASQSTRVAPGCQSRPLSGRSRSRWRNSNASGAEGRLPGVSIAVPHAGADDGLPAGMPGAVRAAHARQSKGDVEVAGPSEAMLLGDNERECESMRPDRCPA